MVKSNVTKTTSKVSLFLQSEIKSLFRKYEKKAEKKAEITMALKGSSDQLAFGSRAI